MRPVVSSRISTRPLSFELLTIAIPALERLAEGRAAKKGKKKLERITRYTTVGLGLLMGYCILS
ncbi:MAG: hypothetical protein ACLU9S_14480 [Oscillospiraceae bacterium]